jgi:hypothetical protein
LKCELKKLGDITQEEKQYIHSHVKIVPLKEIELMVLQNMSFLSCLQEQEKNPEKWNDLTFATPNTEHGLLSDVPSVCFAKKKAVTDYLKN